ncbi:MAG: hypothetical protein HGA65_04650 [Oscillochloris sp.]|nr:hypothetical protein [Oscillochloris sp.]
MKQTHTSAIDTKGLQQAVAMMAVAAGLAGWAVLARPDAATASVAPATSSVSAPAAQSVAPAASAPAAHATSSLRVVTAPPAARQPAVAAQAPAAAQAPITTTSSSR